VTSTQVGRKNMIFMLIYAGKKGFMLIYLIFQVCIFFVRLSITKDSEEMSNFISIFIEEHGQPPAFNIFESCEEVTKR